MPLSSRPAPVERAKPLLGTIVSVRAGFAEAAAARAAIDAAFAEIAAVHRLMSFQEPGSDLSRLRRQRRGEVTAVDPRTAEVLAFALALAEETDGAFDPTVAGRAVTAGGLARPEGEAGPDPGASWRDVILEGDAVRLACAAWLALGGVAKGYAVDRAVRRLQALGATEGCVNAGGDLRVFGPQAELVRLRAGDPDAAPVLELQDGAVASSGGAAGRVATAHFDGRGRERVAPERFACVTAPDCMTADALTKAVLAMGPGSAPVLAGHGARAYAYEADLGWRAWGPAP